MKSSIIVNFAVLLIQILVPAMIRKWVDTAQVQF